MDIPTTIPMETGNRETMYVQNRPQCLCIPADKLYSTSQSAEGTDWNIILLASVGTFSGVLLVAAAALSAAMCVWLCSRRRSRCLSAIHSLCMVIIKPGTHSYFLQSHSQLLRTPHNMLWQRMRRMDPSPDITRSSKLWMVGRGWHCKWSWRSLWAAFL